MSHKSSFSERENEIRRHMEGLDMRMDLHPMQTAASNDGSLGGRYASGLRCVNSSIKLQNSEFMAWSKMGTRISSEKRRSWEKRRRFSAARELCFRVASEDRATSGTGHDTPTSSWRYRFLSERIGILFSGAEAWGITSVRGQAIGVMTLVLY